MDLELGGHNNDPEFTSTNSRVWHIASPGQEMEKKILYHQEVVDMFCLTANDLDILQKDSVEGFSFSQSNQSLFLATQQSILIWNSSACYVSYNNISSQRFEDILTAAKAWVSNGLHIDNVLVILTALYLVYEDIQDQVQKLKSDVQKHGSFAWWLGDLGEKWSLLSSKTKKIMAAIFDSKFPGWVLEPNELQECKKSWNTIPEQLDRIRDLLITKLRNKYWSVILYAVIVGGMDVWCTYKHQTRSVVLCLSALVLFFFSVWWHLFDVIRNVRWLIKCRPSS